MGKEARCEACRKPAEKLHMRDVDGKWVCAHCIPDRELDACPGLRERLGLPARHAAPPRKKAA